MGWLSGGRLCGRDFSSVTDRSRTSGWADRAWAIGGLGMADRAG
jgi:hypothetical protein